MTYKVLITTVMKYDRTTAVSTSVVEFETKIEAEQCIFNLSASGWATTLGAATLLRNAEPLNWEMK